MMVSNVQSDNVLKSLPSQKASTLHAFQWSGMGAKLLDPRIMFWQKGSSPQIDKTKFLPDNWQYTYGGTTSKNLYSTDTGSILIQTPSTPGVYTAYYCYTNTKSELECSVSVVIAVINCKTEKITTSSIEHIIILISENHSFDSIYGGYCKAPTGSKPTCNYGEYCCESAPQNVSGSSPFVLTDAQNALYDPCHSRECEVSEINGGKMDKFVIGGNGSNKYNFAVSADTADSAQSYFNYARNGAMADNFFQSVTGSSYSNNMYFAGGKFFFTDNTVAPQSKDINGAKCYNVEFQTLHDPTIADLLNTCNVTWTVYAEGYDVYPTDKQCWPEYFNAADIPFLYFNSLTQSQTASYNFRDLNKLEDDLNNGTLPSVSYIKGLGIHSEHPGHKNCFTSGQQLANSIINLVINSQYQKNTVIFFVPDESGGFYDHITPPDSSTIDGVQYGPRTQFIAIGQQTKNNYISHVQMEPTSLIKFIEWNWLDGTGQLETRDTVVNNIGDLLDSALTGVEIPIN